MSSEKSKKDKTTTIALQLDGHVTFNGSASANAKLRIASDGLTIEGGIDDFKIPETDVTIKKAGLSIFIGFKQKGNKTLAKDESAGDDAESDNEEASTTTSEGNKSRDDELEQIIADEAILRYVNSIGLDKIEANIDQYYGGISEEIEKETSIEVSMLKSEQKKSKKESKKKESKVVKRESKFEILGVIDIKNVTVKVGLHFSKKKDQTKRDWLVFGTVEGVTLSKIWPELSGTFLNLQLDNVAFIASSEAREKKNNNEKIEDEKEKERTEEDEKKEDGDGDSEKTASWDVLAEVEAYNYPIVRGM